jgi:hypothetical protein
MNAPQNLTQSGPDGRGIVLGEACSEQRPRENGRWTDPALEIDEKVFSDEAVRGLCEEWLVPAIVDHFIRDQMKANLAVERQD